MQYSHSIEKANEYAQAAFERIQEGGLTPTPENYELWYVYYSKVNPEVVHTIDIMISEGKELDNNACREIFDKFLNTNKSEDRVKEAGDQIQKTIRDVTGTVKKVKSATSDYNEALTDAQEKISDDLTQDDMKAILQDMADNTKNMMDQNQLLESQLSASSKAMEMLQRDLELVKREALTDGLTNLANRKAFDAEIERIFGESEAEGYTFTLVMMDIDHFKKFNDNYGHQVGDQVLKLVAKTLKDGLKGRDVAARYGGEEFAIILPETNLSGALKVCEALRASVASKEIVNRNSGEKMGRITMSGGAAEVVAGESIESIIERADTALYNAKRNGRNQISAASSIVDIDTGDGAEKTGS